jgi:hypothetical protein
MTAVSSVKPNRYALVGMKHRGTESFVAELPPDEPLTLVREPDNRFDPNAVQVWARGRHVGYVSKDQNANLAKFIDSYGVIAFMGMDAGGGNVDASRGHSIDAVLHKGSNTWPLVEVNLTTVAIKEGRDV